MGRNPKWTPQEMEHLLRLRSEGKTCLECAEILGRSPKAVQHKMYDKPENLPPKAGRKPLTEEILAYIIEHYSDTLNRELIAKAGISHAALHRIAKHHGLEKSKSFIRKTQREAAEAAYKSHIENGTFPKKGEPLKCGGGHVFKKGENCLMRLGPKKEKMRLQKMAESMAKRRKRERMLIACGLPQQTKLRLTRKSRPVLSLRYHLKKKGYTQSAEDKDAFYIPTEGKRRYRMEEHARQLGMRILSPYCTYSEPDPSKVRSDKLRMPRMPEEAAKPKAELPKAPETNGAERLTKRKMIKRLRDLFDEPHPVGDDIVRDVRAYANVNSYTYQRKTSSQ